MKNKLDPRQYQPYAMNTPSGNLLFEQGVDFFSCYLLENITGNFNITGSLSINGGNTVKTDPTSNVDFENGAFSINSPNSFATGSNNLIINSPSSEISGSNNTIQGGSNNQIANADYAGIIFGANCLVNHTGAAIIGDGDTSLSKQTDNVYALTIDFDSGIHLKNVSYIEDAIVSKLNLGANDKTVPSAYNSAGDSGTLVSDGEYIYCCTGTNAWGRVAVAAW